VHLRSITRGKTWTAHDFTLRQTSYGEIYSYVVGYEPFLPAFRHLLPLIMVLVEVEEGPRLVGYMVNARPEDMRFGMPLRVVFKRLTERVTLPVGEPAPPGEPGTRALRVTSLGS